MRTHLRVLLAVCCLAPLPISSAWADPFLVVPGRSLGRTRLGLNGDMALKNVSPTVSDASMGGKLDRFWRARSSADTLFVHTYRNDMLNPPRPGVTVTEIRATSRRFHTRGGIAPGSTLAQIRRRFPDGRLVSEPGAFYSVSRQGIAFEFAGSPKADTRCVAVTVYLLGLDGPTETAARVRELLDDPGLR